MTFRRDVLAEKQEWASLAYDVTLDMMVAKFYKPTRDGKSLEDYLCQDNYLEHTF